MTATVFNACLLLGWLLFGAGIWASYGLPIACAASGILLIGLTLFVAMRVGILIKHKKPHVPE